MINLDIPLNDNTIRQIIENNYIDRNKYLNGLLNILNTINESKIIAFIILIIFNYYVEQSNRVILPHI